MMRSGLRGRWLLTHTRRGHNAFAHNHRTFVNAFSTSATQPQTDKDVYITTPIFYVNASPHIGHVHSAVLADALARWHGIKGRNVLFTTGTDEHGLKVQEAAEKSEYKTDYKAFCDEVSNRFNAIFERANVQYSRFIRTSDADHHEAVATFWRAIQSNGAIYLGEHEAWYCQSDEAFLTETQVEDIRDSDGNVHKVSKESGHRVVKFSEENYKFRLSAFQDRLLEWLDNTPDVIVPKTRHNEVRAAVVAGLNDISVSRLREKIRWAIDVPDDESHCVYVWLDALTNYLTCTGYPHTTHNAVWPADYHIVGKDILKFHAIYWPAFLMAAGLPLPKKVVAHAHWTVDNVKMSKSLGNVVDPQELIDTYGADFVRYFLLREGVLHDDGDFSTSMLEERVNSELADTLGNLVARSTAKSFLPDGRLPDRPHPEHLTNQDHALITRGQALAAQVEKHFEMPDFRAGIESIVFFLHDVNRYFSENEPWVLNKQIRSADPHERALVAATRHRLNTVLYLTMDSVRVAATLLQPIVPDSATRILDFLNVSNTHRSVAHATMLHKDTDMIVSNQINNTKSFVVFKKLQKK